MIVQNTVVYRGGGVLVITSSGATFTNNTIIRNSATGGTTSQGAGVLAYSGSSISGRNNIFYSNSGGSNPNVYGTATLSYCNVEGGFAGTGNISSNPLFVNTPPTGYFFLSQTAAGQSQNSPCMNAGDPASTMVTGSTRSDLVQDAGVVDIGYHWTYPLYASDGLDFPDDLIPVEESPAQPTTLQLNLRNYPNPFNPTTSLCFTLPEAGQVKLAVYDVTGQLVATPLEGWREAGDQVVTFDATSLVSGVYVYRLTVGNHHATGEMALVK
ncbi:MAG: T9SS type A sorting domain-containing protein [bacterium]|nr:T9SS type A sorting domain-containing protein [bacterium]